MEGRDGAAGRAALHVLGMDTNPPLFGQCEVTASNVGIMTGGGGGNIVVPF